MYYSIYSTLQLEPEQPINTYTNVRIGRSYISQDVTKFAKGVVSDAIRFHSWDPIPGQCYTSMLPRLCFITLVDIYVLSEL